MKLSLALSGGAARGAFHVGVIAALEKHNIAIAAVSGTSIGAVIAAGVGSGTSAFDMIRLFKSKAFRKVFCFNYFYKGVFRINEQAAILREIAPIDRLEKMHIPTFLTCVDVHSGEIVRFCQGDTIKLAMASSALVPIFRPIRYENYLLIDGGFMDNLPVEPLLAFDYPLISVNLFPSSGSTKKRGLLSTWKRAMFLSIFASSKLQIHQSDVCISSPELNHFGMFTFSELMRCFELGYAKGSETILTFMAQKSIIDTSLNE